MTISMSTCHLIVSLNSQVSSSGSVPINIMCLPPIVLVAIIPFKSPTLVLGHNKTRPVHF